MPLNELYDPLASCNRCGYCATICPTYVVTGKETLSARGRNQLVRLVIEGKLEELEEAQEAISTCLLCRACSTVCFSSVPTAHFMAEARAVLAQSAGKNKLRRFLFARIFPRPRVLDFLVKLLFLGKILKISALLRRLGILKLLSPRLHNAEELLPQVSWRFGRQRLSDHPGSKTHYFLSCGVHYLHPQVAQATHQILSQLTGAPRVVRNFCCGLAAHSAGEKEASKALARKNLDLWEKLSVEEIVVDDSSCATFLKEYDKLLPEDPRAQAVSAKIKDISVYLAEHQADLPLAPYQGSVTYHDSCQALNGLGIHSQPREILKKISGLDFRELPESPWCCGGAGTYCLEHPELSQKILERKLEHIQKSGASLVLTTASSCLLQMENGLKKQHSPVKLRHLSEFLAGLWIKHPTSGSES